MSDSLRDRIASAVDDFYIYDPCWHPDDWKVAVANAVIEALPDYLWRCPKCGKGYWADHGPICNVTPPPWGTGQ